MHVRRQRVLSPEQIAEAKRLREHFGYTKRKLADYFEVGQTTIWENVFSTRRRTRRIYFTTTRQKRLCEPCDTCEICMRTDFPNGRIPLSYKVGTSCILCYLRRIGLDFMDISE